MCIEFAVVSYKAIVEGKLFEGEFCCGLELVASTTKQGLRNKENVVKESLLKELDIEILEINVKKQNTDLSL